MRKFQSGFTLVELAVAMTIIGLLIGGVLKGQQLIFNARVQRVIKDISAYTTALAAFEDKYDQLPGDMRTASRRLPGCTGANNCSDGSGNGRIGPAAGPPDRPAGPPLSWMISHMRSMPFLPLSAGDKELPQLFKHLALAEFIVGIDPSSSTEPDDYAWGVTHPAAPFAGGYNIFSMYAYPMPDFRAETVLRMQSTLATNTQVYMSSVGVAPQRLGDILDHKWDDGNCFSGDMVSDCYPSAEGPGECFINIADPDQFTGEYDVNLDGSNCAYFFTLN